MSSDDNGDWLRTDEADDVRGSLRHAMRCRQFVSDDLQAWKWAVLSIHSALQGACVCHLTSTAVPIGAVTKKNAEEWIAYFDADRDEPTVQPPMTYLMALPDLIKALRKPNSAGDRSNDAGIPVNDSELEWLKRFHDDVRNQFTHFSPMGWSIEVSGIPALARLTARIIGDIGNVGWAFRHKDSEWLQMLTSELEALKSY